MAGDRIWGWGTAAGALSADEERALLAHVGAVVPLGAPVAVPTIEEIDLAAPRLAPAGPVASWSRTDALARAQHTYGQAYRDLVRRLERRFERAPDVVALPRDEAEVAASLEWADAHGAVVVPYGGGTSVVGGVEAPRDDDRPVVCLDLARLRGVVEIDALSRAVRCRAGTRGPALEAALEAAGLTLRHYPQSFEFSTLGGWLATHAAGHFATGPTRIDDAVESLRALTPVGVLETGRWPSWGAGPDLRATLLGSEGALGVITEAWLHVSARPTFRASAVARFADLDAALAAARAVAQSGIRPANARVLDPLEALVAGAGDGTASLMLLACESADHPVDSELARLVALVQDHGADVEAGAPADPARRWRDAFVRAPYARDVLVRAGLLVETFETATTWDRLATLRARLDAVVRAALAATGSPGSLVSWRLTHLYPDGAALYATVLAPARAADRVGQWDEVAAHALDAMVDAGAPVTHHHAVGRDHRAHFAATSGPLGLALLAAAKATLDPHDVMNPGALLAERDA